MAGTHAKCQAEYNKQYKMNPIDLVTKKDTPSEGWIEVSNLSNGTKTAFQHLCCVWTAKAKKLSERP